MTIGVNEAQDIIRNAVRRSRSRVDFPSMLAPQEAGIATGPRQRRRVFKRQEKFPDFIAPLEKNVSEDWRTLDDDIYKFAQIRGRQLLQNRQPISHQFIFEVESDLKAKSTNYALGSYLGIVRLAADLDQTRQNQLTGSEKNALHLLNRRLGYQKSNNTLQVEVDSVSEVLENLLQTPDPGIALGIADSLRMLGRSTKSPFLSNVQQISSLHINVIVRVLQIAAQAGKESHDNFGLQVGPMDVFLGARSVLANRSLHHPTLEMLWELVLSENGLYHSDLLDWLRSASVFGTEATIQLPPELSNASFQIRGNRLSALELAILGGKRTVKAKKQEINQFLSTLCDAIIFQVQRQDLHKDVQVKGILQHFNRLLHKERRSAIRLAQMRKQKRHDYLQAVENAKQTAENFQSYLQQTVLVKGSPAPSIAKQGISAREALDFIEPDAEKIRLWNSWLTKTRKSLPRGSSLFRRLMEVLASSRAIDNCLRSGLTPSGAVRFGIIIAFCLELSSSSP